MRNYLCIVEKISYNILNEMTKKNKKENLSVPFTCLSVAINELNQIKNKLDKKNIDIEGLDGLFIQIRNWWRVMIKVFK